MDITFLDYTFMSVANGDIRFDSELKPEQLQVQNGDQFRVEITPKGIILKKVVC